VNINYHQLSYNNNKLVLAILFLAVFYKSLNIINESVFGFLVYAIQREVLEDVLFKVGEELRSVVVGLFSMENEKSEELTCL
jgi:hypothetical protein